jgi:hypothetical protein
MKPVSDIKWTDFNYTNFNELTNKVYDYYTSNFWWEVYREWFWKTILSKSWIKKSIFHSKNRQKFAAFKSVPEIIKNWKLTNIVKNRKNRWYDTYTFSAPITIDGERYIWIVSVNKVPWLSEWNFYLHHVELENLR